MYTFTMSEIKEGWKWRIKYTWEREEQREREKVSMADNSDGRLVTGDPRVRGSNLA